MPAADAGETSERNHSRTRPHSSEKNKENLCMPAMKAFDFPPGSWLLLTFLCLSLPHSLVAYHIHAHTRGPTNNAGLTTSLSNCLITSTHLMEAADMALYQFQKGFNCSIERNPTEDPKNEEKIMKACMEGKSMSGSCPSVGNEAVDQTLCMNTIYKILKGYVMEIKDFGSPDLWDAITRMMKALNINYKITEHPLSSPQHPLNERFEMQMKQCKIFLILQQLTQTIDRILHYRKSVEM